MLEYKYTPGFSWGPAGDCIARAIYNATPGYTEDNYIDAYAAIYANPGDYIRAAIMLDKDDRYEQYFLAGDTPYLAYQSPPSMLPCIREIVPHEGRYIVFLMGDKDRVGHCVAVVDGVVMDEVPEELEWSSLYSYRQYALIPVFMIWKVKE